MLNVLWFEGYTWKSNAKVMLNFLSVSEKIEDELL